MTAAALLLSGCSALGLGGAESDEGAATSRSAPATPDGDATSTPAPGTTPDTPTPGGPSQRSDGSSAACDEVVAGINAFNASDYESTVEHFEKAVPLAVAEDDGSDEATQLIAAVRYYAELAPEDYPEAANSSPEFAQWKAVTLGQCVTGSDQPSPTTTADVV